MKSKLKVLPIGSKTLFTIVGGAVLINPAFAQNQPGDEIDEVVVTGIRGSLKASMNMKRDAIGVVDAISAEDIGKFPDSNLAESLQRITGVSIDRVDGEGSRITARGFGPGFNLITLNGRTMPTADVVVVGSQGDGEYQTFTSRSFDMSNLASEGVSALEVFKTGKASQPTGGIGATINIKTLRPLDDTRRQASVGVKAMFDTSVENGSEITPEVTGVYSWANDNETFGVAVFGSYQKRDSAVAGASNQDWNVEHASSFLNPENGRIRTDDPATAGVNEATVVTGLPMDSAGNLVGDPLVVFPNNSDYFFSEFSRERMNGQLTLQFRPIEALTLTLDGFFVDNESEEQRSTQGNWFNRPFRSIAFDGNREMASAVMLEEALTSPKDIAWGQQFRAVKDELRSYALNAAWKATDRFSLAFDAHTSESKSTPNAAGGVTSYDFGTAAAAISEHSLNILGGFPIQDFQYDDENQNDNATIDIGDVSTSVARTATQIQTHKIDEFRLDGAFEISDSMKLEGGAAYRTAEMLQERRQTQQTLGNWGGENPGDIEANAPGMLRAYCLSCLYDDFSPGLGQVAFRGNAQQLYRTLSPYYEGLNDGRDHTISDTANDHNMVDEDTTALYASFTWKGELGGHNSTFVAGVRYEQTDSRSESLVAIPAEITWVADNDFTLSMSPNTVVETIDNDYSNVLPNLDFSVELVDNVIGRISYSKTIARADYAQLFTGDSAQTPPRAIALGGVAPGTDGNPFLEPLVSNNIDFSLEVYYGDASYVSLGFFNKDVDKFIGIAQVQRTLFGLQDPSSGAPGTRSGDASTRLGQIGAIRNDVNMFVMTAMVANPAAFPNPNATFAANMNASGILNQAYADGIFATYDIHYAANDPQFQFSVATPINNRDANIHGIEFAFQHFFGGSGFGIAGNYTTVDGDVAIDVAADPSFNQFALEGLSDTANATLIYEKYGFSARLAFNWRDEFLLQASRGSFRNPVFVDPYEELDLNVTYDFSEDLSFSFEGINLTGENTRTFGRAPNDYWFVQDLHPRYLLGARYKFN